MSASPCWCLRIWKAVRRRFDGVQSSIVSWIEKKLLGIDAGKGSTIRTGARSDKMNNKAMAMVAVVAMIVATFTGVALAQDVDVDAVPTSYELGEENVSLKVGGDSAAILYTVSEAEYVPTGYTLNWYVGVVNGDTVDFNNGSLGTWTYNSTNTIETSSYEQPQGADDDGFITVSENYKFKMTALTTLGQYILEVKATENASNVAFVLKCAVKVSVDNGYDVPPIYGKIATSIVVDSTAKTLDSMEFTVGKPGVFKISMTGDDNFNTTGKSWYAVSLPTGLSMSSDGLVSGLPTEVPTKNPAIVKVYCSYVNGNDTGIFVEEYSLSIKIKEAATNPSMKFTVGDKTISSKGTYTVDEGTSFVLTVASGTEGGSIENIVVNVVQNSGATRVDYNEDGATIMAGGIGEFHVVVSAVVDRQAITDYFKVNSVSGLNNLTTSLVVNGA